MEKRDIVYVDMDRTTCDYDKAVKLAIAQNPGILYPQSRVDFFRKMEPIEGAIEGINKLNEVYDVWFLTRPSMKNPISYMEKRLWVEDHMGYDWCEN